VTSVAPPPADQEGPAPDTARVLSRSSPLAQAAYRLVMSLEPPCALQGFAGDDMALLLPGAHGTGAIVVDYREDKADAQRARLEQMRSQVRFPLVVAVLGGEEDAARVARGDKPMITSAKQRWVHIADDGAITGDAADTDIARVLAARGAVPDDEQWAMFVARAQEQAAVIDAEIKQVKRFQRLRTSNKPKISVALLVLMGAFFALELAFGGTENILTLLRLGALSGPRVMEGEVYRLLSVAFLHGDLLHLGVNGYVLYRLGSFLEQILGSWRFVVLLIVSVLGGSIASVFVNPEVVAVGASGGLWGVLAAHAILAWRPQGLLPEMILPAARQAALTNLVLNVFVSFMPNIDWAAHFGGGLAGGLMMLLVLRRGLPALKDQSLDEDPGPVPLPAMWLRALAVVLVVLQLSSGAVAVALGKPWVMRTPTYQTVTVDKLGVRLELPTALSVDETASLPPFAQRFGDPRLGPTQCTISVLRQPGVTLEALELMWQAAPEGTTLSLAPQRVMVDGRPGLVAEYSYGTGASSRRMVKIDGELVFEAGCLVLPSMPAWRNVVDRLVESMQIAPSRSDAPPGAP
jgi:rhomboid protease GluP